MRAHEREHARCAVLDRCLDRVGRQHPLDLPRRDSLRAREERELLHRARATRAATTATVKAISTGADQARLRARTSAAPAASPPGFVEPRAVASAAAARASTRLPDDGGTSNAAPASEPGARMLPLSSSFLNARIAPSENGRSVAGLLSGSPSGCRPPSAGLLSGSPSGCRPPSADLMSRRPSGCPPPSADLMSGSPSGCRPPSADLTWALGDALRIRSEERGAGR